MRILRTVLAAFMVLSLATAAQAEEKKIDVKKLLPGKWVADKVDEGSLPKGSILVFEADGKMSITVKGDKEMKIEGTYVVDGQTFTANLKEGGVQMAHKVTIKCLDEKELEATNDQGKSVTFKRVK